MNGILLVDKPQGWTSNDVVAKLRGVLHEKRIGHSGTLDPLATGLLVIFVGRATRAVEFAEGHDKEYIASLRLGISTDTQDITGNVLSRRDSSVSVETLEKVLDCFRGSISQIPPMYSAIKVNGQRLYNIARRGGSVERKAREINISALDIIGRDGEDYVLRVACSKGTYIRTLCNDIGEALGCGGCMSSLRRIKAGDFSVDEAFALDDIIAGRVDAEKALIPVDTLFRSYPKITVDEGQEKKLRCGNQVNISSGGGTYRVYSESGEFLLLGHIDGGILKTIKSFFEV